MRVPLVITLGAVMVLTACARSTPSPTAPTVQHVYPATFRSGGPQLLLVKGSGFEMGAQVLVGGAELQEVTWVNETLLAVRVPSGLSQGRYEVMVRNPSGFVGSKGDALVVTPPPQPVVTRPQPPLPLLPTLKVPPWDNVLDALRKQVAGQRRRLHPKEADDLERRIGEIERQIREGRYREAAQNLRDLLARLDELARSGRLDPGAIITFRRGFTLALPIP